jgi:hypothetical protein
MCVTKDQSAGICLVIWVIRNHFAIGYDLKNFFFRQTSLECSSYGMGAETRFGTLHCDTFLQFGTEAMTN